MLSYPYNIMLEKKRQINKQSKGTNDMKNSEKLLQYTKLYFPATKTATSCGNSILATAAISKAIVWIKIFQSFNERIP